MPEAMRYRAGCSIGSGIGGLPGIESESLVLAAKGPSTRVAAFRPWPADQPHLAARFQHQIRIDGAEPRGRHRLFHRRAFDRRRGADDPRRRCRHHACRRRPNRPSARSASPASRRRARCRPGINDAGRSRPAGPMTSDRDGFVMGEGAGVVVPRRIRARQGTRRQDLRRGRRLRPVGRRLPRHRAASRRVWRVPFAMQMALAQGGDGLPGEIDYINAHGTSTPLGDELELGAVRRLFGDAIATVSMSSTKSGDWASAGRRRRGGGDLLYPGDARPDRPADAQPR